MLYALEYAQSFVYGLGLRAVELRSKLEGFKEGFLAFGICFKFRAWAEDSQYVAGIAVVAVRKSMAGMLRQTGRG